MKRKSLLQGQVSHLSITDLLGASLENRTMAQAVDLTTLRSVPKCQLTSHQTILTSALGMNSLFLSAHMVDPPLEPCP